MDFDMKVAQFLCISLLSLLTGMIYPMERSVGVNSNYSLSFDPSVDFQLESGEIVKKAADSSVVLHVNFDRNVDVVKIVVDYARPTQQSLAQITFAKKVQQIAFDLMQPNERKVMMTSKVGRYYDLDEEKNKGTRTTLVGELDEDAADIKSYGLVINSFVLPSDDQSVETFLSASLIAERREDLSFLNKVELEHRVNRVAERLKKQFDLDDITTVIAD